MSFSVCNTLLHLGILRLITKNISFTQKIGTELFLLTYGALVAQLIQDYEDNDEINTQLDKRVTTLV